MPSFERVDGGCVLPFAFAFPDLWLSVYGIFLGGASECTMAQWASGYLEAALGIPKVWGDGFGVALFELALGNGRMSYGKFGKNAPPVLFLVSIGATLCYLTAALSSFSIMGLFDCVFTGFCTSMLWPESLIVSSDRFPKGGVVLYALMAAGGDLGASVGPWAVGLVAEVTMANGRMIKLAVDLALTPDQLGIKLGILVGMLFPLFGIFIYALICKNVKMADKNKEMQIVICKTMQLIRNVRIVKAILCQGNFRCRLVEFCVFEFV